MTKESIINLINEKENERIRLQEEIDSLKKQLEIYDNNQNKTVNILSKEEKIKIFMDYFKGRDDTYPYLSIDKNTPNKKYYIPACINEWKKGICNKSMRKPCKTCKYRENKPLTYDVYEKLGCQRIYETVVENKEYGKLGSVLTEKAFIYEKKL